MLQHLHVKNLALIDEIEVEVGRGTEHFNRRDRSRKINYFQVLRSGSWRKIRRILRQGARYGLVELNFQWKMQRQIRKLKELDVYPEDGMVVLCRGLMEGRSVSKINGETVTMSLLKEVASVLIDIHGQHEHQSLLYKKESSGDCGCFCQG